MNPKDYKLCAVLYASLWERPEVMEVVGRLAQHGIPFKLYGGNGQWRGYGEQIRMAHEAATTLTQYTHLLVINAFDVLVLAGAERIMATWETFNHPWVFNAEKNCYPDRTAACRYPAPGNGSRWQYLNSGAYLAERTHLLTWLTKWGADQVPLDTNDQGWFTERFLENRDAIQLDTGCVLFQSMLARNAGQRAQWIVTDEDRAWCFNKETHTSPLVLHFNGTQLHDTAFFDDIEKRKSEQP